MAIKQALGRNRVASAPQAGLLVVNDLAWAVEAAAANDLVEIGELSANHKLFGEGCSLFAQLDANSKLAAQTFSVFVGGENGETVDNADNTIFSGVAITADTAARTPLSLHLVAEKLGVSQVNRKIYLKLTAAPATAAGVITARIASFPRSA